MRKKAIVVALVAVVSAGGAAIMVQKWLAAERAALQAKTAQVQKVEPTMILVAQKYMPSGQFIRSNQLQWQSWPDANVLPAYVVKGKANLTDFDGAVVRQGIPSGQPITNDMIAQPGERGFLAAVLMPGMRALSVHVDATTGISGFVFPGDRIDLVLSHRIVSKKSTDTEADSQQVSETILTDVRVLAIDQNSADLKGKPQVVKNVTLEVTPEHVEVVAVAQQLGRLSLSLRSLARKNGDPDKATTIAADGTPEPSVPGRGDSFTRDTQVSHALRKSTTVGPYIDIVRGKDAKRETVSVGQNVTDISARLKTVALPNNSVQAATNDVKPTRPNDNTEE